MKPENKQTHFGFEQVGWDEKTQRVRGVFDSVSARYDLMNDVMSGGMQRIWKTRYVAQLGLRSGQTLLDLAGGTGDIAARVYRRYPNAAITICDINESMLRQGVDRLFDQGIRTLDWTCGNAESLPFADGSFDACTMAFGIRNVTDIPAALREIFRVLKFGGRFMCLEFSTVKNPLLKPVYDAYSFQILPRMGEWIAQDKDSYQYLAESIRQFPDQETFAGMLRDAGFEQVRYQNMSGGIVAIHSGWKR